MVDNNQLLMGQREMLSTGKKLAISVCLLIGSEAAICAYLYYSRQLAPEFLVPFSIMLFVITLPPIVSVFFHQSNTQVKLTKRTHLLLQFFASQLFAIAIVPVLAGLSIVLFSTVREQRLAAFFSILAIGTILHWGAKTLIIRKG